MFSQLNYEEVFRYIATYIIKALKVLPASGLTVDHGIH